MYQGQNERVLLLVKELESLLCIPRVHIEKYMMLRSSRSVERLSKLLKDYKKGCGDRASSISSISRSHITSTCSTNTRSTPRTGSEVHPAVSKGKREKVDKLAEARQRVKQLTWQSTYNNFFSTSGISATPNGAAKLGSEKSREIGMKGAVGKVWRPDLQEQLEQWQAATTDDNVQQLTELCRGLCSVQSHGQKGSEYQKQFLRSSVYGLNHLVPFENKANLSSVPIGSIYRTDPWELEASEKREKEMSCALKRVSEQQGKMMNHRHFPKTVEELVFIDANKAK